MAYILRRIKDQRYYTGEGNWRGKTDNRRWVPVASTHRRADALCMDEDEVKCDFPDGIPAGWELVCDD